MKVLSVGVCAVLVMTLWSKPVAGQSIILDRDEQRVFEDLNWLPYAFSSESFGFAVGVGVGYSGWPQEQSSAIGALTVGTEGAYNAALALTDWQVPGVSRLVVEPLVVIGKYENQRLHIGQNFEPGSVRAGANGSDPDDFLEASQWDNRAEVAFRYLFPVGHGRDTTVSRYVIDGGLLTRGASGGSDWNPFESGRTRLSLTPAWREQTDRIRGLDVPFSTVNLAVELERDNYDFPYNPSQGSYQSVEYQRDFEDSSALGGWESWSVELGKAFTLPSGGGSEE